MSTDQLQEKQLNTIVEDTLLQFKEAIKSQEQQSIQFGRRTSHLIRYGLLLITLLSIGVIFLSWSQKNDMAKMHGFIQGMSQDISVMSNAIVSMQSSMSTIEGGINRVSSHTQSISSLIGEKENMLKTLSHIADTVKLMQSDAHGLGNSMVNVNYNLSNINKHMKSLNRKLGTMVHDANRMPSPTKMFPF